MFESLYRNLLLLCPREFTQTYGEQMQELFEESLAAQRDGPGAFFFALRAYADLIVTACSERFSAVKRDIGFALRLALRSPVHSLIIIGTLAIATGVGTAVFSAVDAVLVAPLPYAHPERIVAVREYSLKNPDARGSETSLPNSEDWRHMSRSFTALGSFAGFLTTRTDVASPEALGGAVVTGGFFDALGVHAQLGRLLNDADTQSNAPRRVVLADEYWRRAYNASPTILGKTIRLNGDPYAIVGVLPPGFVMPRASSFYESRFELYRPLPRNATTRDANYLDTFARLAPGATAASAESDMNRIAAILRNRYPVSNSGKTERVLDLRAFLFGDAGATLAIASAAVAGIILIACLNVGNMLLARMALREREVAVRMAVGASRGRVLRQLLFETSTYAAIGGVLGVALCAAIVRGIASLDLPIPRLETIAVNPLVIVAAFAIVAFTAITTALAPALLLPEKHLSDTLKAAGRGASDARGKIARTVAVIVEIALAIALVTSSALLVRSFAALASVDVGFSYDGAVAGNSVRLPANRYKTPQSQGAFASELIAKLRAIPGFEDPGLMVSTPLSNTNDFANSFTIVGEPPAPGAKPEAEYNAMTPGAFRLLAFHVLRGRGLLETDGTNARKVAVVTKTFVSRFFHGANPIGKSILTGFNQDESREIVGVIDDFKAEALTEAPLAQILVPFYQDVYPEFQIVGRSRIPLAALSKQVSAAIRSLDPLMPARTFGSYERYIEARRAQTLVAAELMLVLAAIALLLAAVGTYGVVAYNVAQRRQEFGIRRSLGARSGSIVAGVLRQTLLFAAAGIALGFALSVPMAGAVQSLLYNVPPVDLVTFAFVALALLAVAIAASLQPALAATRVDPIVVLRYE